MAKGKGKTGKPFKVDGPPKGQKRPAGGGTKMVGKGMKGKKGMGGKGDCY